MDILVVVPLGAVGLIMVGLGLASRSVCASAVAASMVVDLERAGIGVLYN